MKFTLLYFYRLWLLKILDSFYWILLLLSWLNYKLHFVYSFVNVQSFVTRAMEKLTFVRSFIIKDGKAPLPSVNQIREKKSSLHIFSKADISFFMNKCAFYSFPCFQNNVEYNFNFCALCIHVKNMLYEMYTI